MDVTVNQNSQPEPSKDFVRPGLSLKTVLQFFVVVFPIIVVVIYIVLYAENVPVGHDWVSFEIYRISPNFKELLVNMWLPQNGARAFFPQLIYLVDYELFGLNTYHGLVLSISFMILSVIGIWISAKDIFGRKIIHFAPLTWLWFSLAQYKDFLTGWHFLIHLSIMSAIWAFVFLHKSGVKNTVYALLLYCLSFYSFGSGLMVFPVGIMLLQIRKSSLRSRLLWIICGGLITGIYFIGFEKGNTIAFDSISQNLLTSIRFFFQLQGNSLAVVFGYFGFIGEWIVTFVGFALFSYTVWLAWIVHKGKHKLPILAGSMMIYAYLVFCVIVFGRVQRGISVAAAYIAIPIFYVGVLYITSCLHFASNKPSNRKLHMLAHRTLTTAMVLSSLVGALYGFYMGPYLKGERIKQKYRILNYESQDYQVDACKYLESARKSVFSSNYREDVFLHLFEVDKFKETGNIYMYANEDTIYQQMACPVDHLDSVGVMARALNPKSSDSITVDILDSNKQLVSTQKLSADEVFQTGRFFTEAGTNTISRGDTLFFKVSRKGKSINVPLFREYPGAPTQLNTVNKGYSSISVEINPPQDLEAYYKHLAYRSKLKLFIRKFVERAG